MIATEHTGRVRIASTAIRMCLREQLERSTYLQGPGAETVADELVRALGRPELARALILFGDAHRRSPRRDGMSC